MNEELKVIKDRIAETELEVLSLWALLDEAIALKDSDKCHEFSMKIKIHERDLFTFKSMVDEIEEVEE